MPVILAFKNSSLVDMTQKDKKMLTKGCSQIVKLQDQKSEIIEYTESHMNRIAPNLTKVLGSSVTAKLISKVGGLKRLAEFPSCNIQMIGHERKNLAGLSKSGKTIYVGFISECELVRDALEEFRMKMIKFVSNAVAKASRVDQASGKRDGSYGVFLYNKITKDFEKYKEPKQGQEKQPLTIPDDKPKRRRGGKKYRKQKERMGLTDARLLKNRLNFGTDFSQDMDLNGKEDRGMLGQSNIGGRLRVNKRIQKMTLTQRQKQIQRMKMNKGGIYLYSTIIIELHCSIYMSL